MLKLGAHVEGDGAFDGVSKRVGVEERRGVDGFDHGRGVEGAVAEGVLGQELELEGVDVGRIQILAAEAAVERESKRGRRAGASVEVGVPPSELAVGAAVGVTEIAAAPRGIEVRGAAVVGVGVGEVDLLQIELVQPAEAELKREGEVELLGGGQAEGHARLAVEIGGVVLDDGAREKLAQRARAGCAVARPARALHGWIGRAVRGIASNGRGERQRVRHAARDRRLVKSVDVLADTREIAEIGALELRERGIELRHEQGIVRALRAQGVDEWSIDGEVVGGGVAAAAGAAIAVERLAEEEVGAGADLLRNEACSHAHVVCAGREALTRRERL